MSENETVDKSVCIDISADHPEAMAAWSKILGDFSEGLVSEEGVTVEQFEAFLQAGNGWYYTRSSQSREISALEVVNPLLYPEAKRFGRAQADRGEQVKFCEESIRRLEEEESGAVFSSEKSKKAVTGWKALAQKLEEAPPLANQ